MGKEYNRQPHAWDYTPKEILTKIQKETHKRVLTEVVFWGARTKDGSILDVHH